MNISKWALTIYPGSLINGFTVLACQSQNFTVRGSQTGLLTSWAGIVQADGNRATDLLLLGSEMSVGLGRLASMHPWGVTSVMSAVSHRCTQLALWLIVSPGNGAHSSGVNSRCAASRSCQNNFTPPEAKSQWVTLTQLFFFYINLFFFCHNLRPNEVIVECNKCPLPSLRETP